MIQFNTQQSHAFLMHLAEHAQEYAGIPYPIEGEDLLTHPSYRFTKVFEDKREAAFDKQVAERDPDEPLIDIINGWLCQRTKRHVFVIQERRDGAKRIGFTYPMARVFDYAVKTLGLVCAWKLDAELKAQEKLAQLVTPHAFTCYTTTGSFLETSPRSGVTYMFRRCRPTVAMREHQPGDIKVLCTLCLHPIGYYDKSFGGSLVPTDDVIAHLMLMRGDEPHLWRLANQHPKEAVQSDL